MSNKLTGPYTLQEPSKGFGAIPAQYPLPGFPGVPLPDQQGLLQPAQSLPNPQELGRHAGPFIKAPTTSLDAFLNLDPQAMGRAASLPSNSAKSHHSPAQPSNQWPDFPGPINPMDFKARLLQAMPMGRSNDGRFTSAITRAPYPNLPMGRGIVRH